MKGVLFSFFLALSATAAIAQSATPPETPQPPNYANYSIMLVSPVAGASAVVLMHNPTNALEFVDVTKTQSALNSGYVAVRLAEITSAIDYLHAENSRLTAENMHSKGSTTTSSPVVVIAPQSSPSEAQIEAQQRVQAEAEKDARRQQVIQEFMMMQNANRPQTQNLNVTVTNCTRFPALCAGR